MSKKFNISWKENPQDNTYQSKLVNGYLVTIPELPSQRFFVHCDKSGSYRYWNLTEHQTGLKCVGINHKPSKKEEVIAKFEAFIAERGIEYVNTTIESAKEKMAIINT